MDSEAIRKKRQDDIEAKRKRLEEMRRSRQESAAAAPAAPVAPAAASVAVPPPKTEKENKAETEELVNSLLTSLPVSKVETPPDVSVKSREELLQEKLKSFSTVKSFNIIDIIPASIVKYEKSTQTEEEDRLFLVDPSEQNVDESGYQTDDAEVEADAEMKTTTPGTTPAKGFKSPTPGKTLFSNSKQQQVQPHIQITSEMETEASFHEKAKIKLLPEECTRIISNKKFEKFLQTSSLYVERAMALTEEHDVIRDFMVDDSNTAEDGEHSAFILPPPGSSSSITNATGCYEEDQLVGRPVMALQWSHLLPGLFLAAYGSKTTTSSTTKASSAKSSGMTEEDAPGMVCVWDRDMHARPEFRLTASSPVLTAVFHSHEKNLVLGGCYSGQILLWDTRLNKTLPVQRSSMSGTLRNDFYLWF